MSHFEGKDPLTHIHEKRGESALFAAEFHGSEMPGHLHTACDACREVALYLLLLWTLLSHLNLNFLELLTLLALFSLGLIVWKTGRSALLAWSRLERLHRVISQEKYEIEHHRDDEREELRALYAEKGFQGKLLDDVVDVLMADQDRLLKVMLEEELGLTLEAYEHPLKQATGALVGSFIAVAVSLLLFYFLPIFGMILAALLLMGTAAFIAALREKNRVLANVVWNLAVGAVAFGIVYEIATTLFSTSP